MTIVTSPYREMRGIAGSQNNKELCPCSNHTVKNSADAVRRWKKTQEKSKGTHLETETQTLKLTISSLPVLKMYTTINVIALANFF